MSSLESEHNTAMSDMKLENEQTLTATVEAVKEDEKNQFSKEMEEIKQHLEEDKVQAIAEAVTSIQEQLKTLKDVSDFYLYADSTVITASPFCSNIIQKN